jgi:hypothetical protein
VDYDKLETIVSVLEQNKIETIISAVNGQSPVEHELNLVKAADKSSMTRRYIPNIWGIQCTEE